MSRITSSDADQAYVASRVKEALTAQDIQRLQRLQVRYLDERNPDHTRVHFDGAHDPSLLATINELLAP